MAIEKSNDQFKKDMTMARTYVSAELKKYNIDIDVRLLTTISIMQSTALKFIDNSISAEEARDGFNTAMMVYSNSNNLPF